MNLKENKTIGNVKIIFVDYAKHTIKILGIFVKNIFSFNQPCVIKFFESIFYRWYRPISMFTYFLLESLVIKIEGENMKSGRRERWFSSRYFEENINETKLHKVSIFWIEQWSKKRNGFFSFEI